MEKEASFGVVPKRQTHIGVGVGGGGGVDVVVTPPKVWSCVRGNQVQVQ